jgi:hypothetical protein
LVAAAEGEPHSQSEKVVVVRDCDGGGQGQLGEGLDVQEVVVVRNENVCQTKDRNSQSTGA